MRIGELLVQDGLLTEEQVQQVLRQQVMLGGRFGTNAIELFMQDLDQLARCLSRQHQLPAALAKHFEGADVALQKQLSPDLAAKYSVLPLRRVGDDHVAIALIAPLDGRGRALVADQLGISYKGLIPAIAPELRIHWQLERVYGIARDTRFLRSRKRSTVPSLDIDIIDDDVSGPVVTIAAAVPEPVVDPGSPPDAIPEELPDFVATHPIEIGEGDRRHYIPKLGEAQLGRIELKQRASSGTIIPPIARAPDALDEALRVIRRAIDRESITQRTLEAVSKFCGAPSAMFLVVRGDVATGRAGYHTAGTRLPDIAVPLEEPGLVPNVVRSNTLARAASGNLGAVDFLVLDTLGVPDGDLVIAPLAIGSHVFAVIALATATDAPVDDIAAICDSAATAFTRLLRNAKR